MANLYKIINLTTSLGFCQAQDQFFKLDYIDLKKPAQACQEVGKHCLLILKRKKCWSDGEVGS